MAIHIEDPQFESVVETLARQVGKTPEEYIVQTLRERWHSPAQPRALAPDWEARVREIVDSLKALPVLDPRSPDEILGYDENGLPS